MLWRMLDLFSGIGGFSLAAQWVWGDDLEIVAFCEIDKFCQKVLKQHWPNVPIIEDVRDVTLEYTRLLRPKKYEKQTTGIEQPSQTMAFAESGKSRKPTKPERREDSCRGSKEIDLLTGGFPCQPFSVAGKRKGKEDNRFLWPEMFRVIKEIRPRWVLAENVAGIVRMALDDCLSDLEGEGYSTQAIIIPACAVNAPHRRDRVWIMAHAEQSCGRRGIFEGLSDSERRRLKEESEGLQPEIREAHPSDPEQGSQDVADTRKQERDRLSGIGRKEMAEIGDGGKDESDTNEFNGDGTRLCSSQISQFKKTKISGCEDVGKSSFKDGGKGKWFPGTIDNSIGNWSTEPNVGRVAYGIPSRVDRLRSLGNAIVPHVAEVIFRAIKAVGEHREDRWRPM